MARGLKGNQRKPEITVKSVGDYTIQGVFSLMYYAVCTKGKCAFSEGRIVGACRISVSSKKRGYVKTDQ